MLTLACEAGATPDEFWRMSWREYSCFVEGHKAKRNDDWLRWRELMAAMYNTSGNMKKGKRMKGKDFIKLPGDMLDFTPSSTYEQFVAACKRFNLKLPEA